MSRRGCRASRPRAENVKRMARQGQVAQAIDACERAVRLNPNCAEAHNNLGVCLEDAGRYDQAMASLRRAIDWRWMVGGSETPWYPTMRLFRQGEIGRWDACIRDVADALAGFQA
jgi:tetratricopeptide (TPR) repeat protein